MARSDDLKRFREANFITYLENNGVTFDVDIAKGERIKLCSSDDFRDVVEEFEGKYNEAKAPVIIGHVGGFYVTATLAGLSENISTSKPYVLFFDRKDANIQNAIYNTLLMKACRSKEQYICRLFGLSSVDVVKAIKPALYASFIEAIIGNHPDLEGVNKKDRREILARLYKADQANIDKQIKEKYVDHNLVEELLASEDFSLSKIERYAKKRKYNPEDHYDHLLKYTRNKLSKKEFEVFEKLASHMTSYLAKGDNYSDLIKYLTMDITKNKEHHILASNEIFEGYKRLFAGRGSYIKFVPGIDISTQKGVQKLEKILRRDGFISEAKDDSAFDVDLAFIPHMNQLKEAYPFLKKHVQDYIMLYKDPDKRRNHFVTNSTATLEERTLDNIGASFIAQERKKRKELKDLSPIEKRNGFPLIMFMGGSNFGNIYHSEVDTNNMIDMAIANKVDTVYIQGLIYATYYHNQTSRRMLTDPKYETLGSRLQAAQKIIKKLNAAGIKVVYQMGDEEYNLYLDLFKIYVREQGVKGNNFLQREDLKSKFDWVRPIILQDLIPYMIRSGEDVANLYTDDESHTNVSKICHAIKRCKEGLPQGDLAGLIKPEFLQNDEMFRIVSSTVDRYSKKDSAIAVNLVSSNGTSRGNATVKKSLSLHQSDVIDKAKLGQTPQLFVDSKKPSMTIAYEGDQFTMNVPPMINDSYYMENPGLLAGIKETVKEDPTYKRVNYTSLRPNYPGGWMITGDIRDRMVIIPYYRRVKEVMNYVQKTGKGLEQKTVGYLNDWHIGSLTERPDYDVKFMDYLFYHCNPTGAIVNGDFQQGYNYGSYPVESRHVGATSMTQQMVSATKLIKPYMKAGFGVIKKGFEGESKVGIIDKPTSRLIIDHLAKIGLIETDKGVFENTNRIKRGIDYRTVDLKLPEGLRQFEGAIRDKLSKIINLEFFDVLEGNHEWNSDWDHKGFNEIELLRKELENLRDNSGSDIDITLPEFITNPRGDFVYAPNGFRTINGYNNIFAHCVKGGGGTSTPTVAISNWLRKMSPNLPRIDKVNSAHYHLFETSVINNTLISITGAGVGQSGYEQNLGYGKQPLYVIERYLPDGRISIETIGAEFLEKYQIQNPEIKEIGLDAFIQKCFTEEAPIFGKEEPKKVQRVYQRSLVPKKVNRIIGPNID